MQRITTWLALGTLLTLAHCESAKAQRQPPKRSAARQVSYDLRYGGGDTFSGGCADGNCGSGGPIGDSYSGDSYIGDPAFGDEVIYDDCGDGFCSDGMCSEPSCGLFGGCRLSAGVELTFLKPHFENNVAFTTLQSDGATFDNFATTPFEYSTELAPRIWLEMLQMGELGLRATYWQFDETAASLTGQPDANGFGRIDPPPFADIDLSTTVPGSMYTASSALNAFTIDIEGTKSFDCGMWGWMASAGLRYAEVEQSYDGTLINATGATQGTIDFDHRIEGIGPTVSVRTQRPFTSQLSLFGFARGALLFGEASSTLNAIEDQDLTPQFDTEFLSSRDDVLPVGEVQVGFQWTPNNCGMWYPYFHLAMEGQLWGGAGDSASQTGNLGFYGLNVAFGVDW